MAPARPTSAARNVQWTSDEHERYLEALALYPSAPWKVIAAHVGTRTTRQVMTHANKIKLKAQRHARGLRAAGRPRRDSSSSDESTTETKKPRRKTKRDLAKAAHAVVSVAAAEAAPRAAAMPMGFVEMLDFDSFFFQFPDSYDMDCKLPMEMPASPTSLSCSIDASGVFAPSAFQVSDDDDMAYLSLLV